MVATKVTQALLTQMQEVNCQGTLVELGSGLWTPRLTQWWTVCSVTHEMTWVEDNVKNLTCIFAPLNQGWYSPEILKQELPGHYDLLLVHPRIDRRLFFKHMGLFRENTPIILSDLDRQAEETMLIEAARDLNRVLRIYGMDGDDFAII